MFPEKKKYEEETLLFMSTFTAIKDVPLFTLILLSAGFSTVLKINSSSRNPYVLLYRMLFSLPSDYSR